MCIVYIVLFFYHLVRKKVARMNELNKPEPAAPAQTKILGTSIIVARVFGPWTLWPATPLTTTATITSSSSSSSSRGVQRSLKEQGTCRWWSRRRVSRSSLNHLRSAASRHVGVAVGPGPPAMKPTRMRDYSIISACRCRRSRRDV